MIWGGRSLGRPHVAFAVQPNPWAAPLVAWWKARQYQLGTYDCLGVVLETDRLRGIATVLPEWAAALRTDEHWFRRGAGLMRRLFNELYTPVRRAVAWDALLIEDRVGPHHPAVYLGDGRILLSRESAFVVEPLEQRRDQIVGAFRAE